MKKAEKVYQKITGYANYSQMNGIEKSWIIKCIDEALKEQLTLTDVSFILPSDSEITKYVKDLQPPKGCDKFSVDTGFVKGAIYIRELANSKNLKGN